MKSYEIEKEIRRCRYRLEKLNSINYDELRRRQKWQLVGQKWLMDYLDTQKIKLETRISLLKESKMEN